MKRISYIHTFVLGFLAIILVGSILLTLPISSNTGETTSFINALFTATSASCVTGLVIYDTFTHFSFFGQIVILVLIQIGGLGFIAIISFFLFMLRKHISLNLRNMLAENVGSEQVGGTVRLIKKVFIVTAILEFSGAVILSFRFCPVLGLRTGIYYGIFHSISAFCNAGFDLFGRFGEYTSLVPFRDDLIVNFTVMSLIIIGGLGFIVWRDFSRNKFHFSKYKLHSKIVIIFTILLIFGGAFLFYFMENNYALENLTTTQRFLPSLFQSVTSRTAGFNTLNIANLSPNSKILTMILMFIGASPVSTGGGLKTTTIAIVIFSVIGAFKNSDDINIFGKRVDTSALKRAFNTIALYVFLVVTASMAILTIQQLPTIDVFFETVSAIGTVGLSTGITRSLLPLSKVIIIFLMFCGRIGSITLVASLASVKKEVPKTRNLEEKIIIG